MMMPLMRLPVTSVAVKTSRGVVLFAPGRDIAKQESMVSRFGRVTDIVAPNLFHHLSIHKAQQTFPQATLWGVPGVKTKRPDIEWNKSLSETSWTFSDEIKVLPVLGVPRVNEFVFFHLKTKTLVVTDLFFNMLHAKGLGAWIFFNMFGTYRRFAISKLYLKGVQDRAALIKSLRQISALDFKTIVMSHGEPVTENARELFQSAIKERGLQ